MMIRPRFTLSSPTALQNRYRRLLEEDFNDATLADCLALLRRILETSGRHIQFEWEKSRRPRKSSYLIPPAAVDYLREYLERSNADLAHEVPDEVPDGTALERVTQEVAVFLTFQSRVQLEGETGFFRDVQSLLFVNCIHVLSPKLVARNLVDADGYLMNALYNHAKIAWTDSPEHENYLLSLLFEHVGMMTEAMDLLRASLNNASVSQHDFVTKAQTYWSMLVEANHLDEATHFILDLYRRALPKDLPELKTLLDETYAMGETSRRAS